MIVGVPKEIKAHEYRVGLTPESVRALADRGHDVVVETGAGAGIGAGDADYETAGATIAEDAEHVFAAAGLVVKVKEPQPAEYALLQPRQTLFTYLHLAADPVQAEALMASGLTAIAYETVTDADGRLPLLTPMSEVAGRLSVQAGAHFLEKAQGGAGVLIGGVPGVAPADVVIIGGGTAGTEAARMALGLGGEVTVLDISRARLAELDDLFSGRVQTVFSTADALERRVTEADLVIGAVLVPGAAAPKLVSGNMIKAMREGSVVVDIAIDQGGCFKTSRPTTHDNPTFVVDGVIHYCVTNMPGAVAKTSTYALNNATLPFVLKLADLGTEQALAHDPHLAHGLNVRNGELAHEAVATALGKKLGVAPN